jgi:dihydropteroate synthase
VRVSIDTTKPAVAEAAVGAGATLVNDVSCTLDAVAADLGVGWVAMHSRGDPRTMQSLTDYDDVVTEVRDLLVSAADRARSRGVEEIWIDPGIGFAKTADQNWQLLAHLDALVSTGVPVLVGTSRKAFLGALLGASDRAGRARGDAMCRSGHALAAGRTDLEGSAPPEDRLEGSAATVTWAAAKGARMVRVHDVRASSRAVTVVHGRP